MKKTILIGLCLIWFVISCAATKQTITAYDKDGNIVSVTETLKNYAVTKTDKKETSIPKPGWWTTMVNTFFKEFSGIVGDTVGTVVGK